MNRGQIYGKNDDKNDDKRLSRDLSIGIGVSSIAFIGVVRLFYSLISLFAAYVCFKINKGFSWSIILALLFSPIYLIYAYAKYGKQPFKLK